MYSFRDASTRVQVASSWSVSHVRQAGMSRHRSRLDVKGRYRIQCESFRNFGSSLMRPGATVRRRRSIARPRWPRVVRLVPACGPARHIRARRLRDHGACPPRPPARPSSGSGGTSASTITPRSWPRSTRPTSSYPSTFSTNVCSPGPARPPTGRGSCWRASGPSPTTWPGAARRWWSAADGPKIVPKVAAGLGAADVFATRDVGPFARRRDRAVGEVLAAAGRRLHLKRGLLVAEPEEVAGADGGPVLVFSPFFRRWAASWEQVRHCSARRRRRRSR